METWLEVLLGMLAGLILGAGGAFLVLTKNPKKPPMTYEDFNEIFYGSVSTALIVSTLREMHAATKPYPRWKDVAKVYLSSKKDLHPMQFYALWTFAEKYKKKKDVLKMYPDCEKIARFTMRGEHFSKIGSKN